MAYTGYLVRYFGAATTATGNHWGSIRLHGTWTTDPGVANLFWGFWNPTTNSASPIGNPSLDYTRNTGVVNLAATGYKLAVWILISSVNGAGEASLVADTVLACHGLGSRVPDEVPSQTAAGSGKTRTQGTITTAHDPDDTEGTIDVLQIPRLHGTSAPTSAETILECGSTEIVGLDGSGDLEVYDGTNEANADLTESDGTERTIRAAWEAGDVDDLYAAVVIGGDDGTATYDGAFPAGNVEVKGTCRSTRAVRIYDGAQFDTDEAEV